MSISPRVDELIASAAAHPEKSIKLGIMGGTFDPIHFGHLICAEQAREQFDLDYVIFMPTGNPVFKVDKKVSPAEDRYEMVQIATRKNPQFDVSRIEIEREGLTYTYDTIVEIKRQLPENASLYFITGGDAIMSVLKWRNAEELIKMVHFVAAARPGYDYSQLEQAIEENPELFERVSFFEVPGLEISSTDIRKRISEGRSVVYMTPVSVVRYIEEKGLYV